MNTPMKATWWKMAGLALLWVAFAAFVSVPTAFAAPSFHWESVSPYPNLVGNSVTFGEGKFIAIADDRTLGISEDAGRTWHHRYDLPPQDYAVVGYGNGQFVAIGTDKVIVSEDGLAWSSYTVTNIPGVLSLNYWNGKFVATGRNGLVATSLDGQSWTSTNIINTNLAIVAVSPNKLLAVEGGIVLLHSTNGIDWTRQTANLPNPNPPHCSPFCYEWDRITGLAWFQGKFVAQVSTRQSDLAGPAVNLISTNGTSWVEVSRSASAYYAGLLTLNDQMIERNSPYDFYLSAFTTNVINWTTFSLKGNRTNEAEPVLSTGAFGEETYVLTAGGVVARGTNLQNLERIDSPVKSARLLGLAVDGNTMVAVQSEAFGAPGSTLIVSTNGGRWFEPVESPAGSGALKAVEFAQGKFVAVGNGGTVIRTTNGYTLSRRLSNTSADLADVAFGNGQWIAVGANGTIISSPDASTFSLRNSGTAISLSSVTFGQGLFVAVGQSGLILTSTDGVNWSGQGTEEAQHLLAVAYGNGTFVATGNNRIVHASTNGVDWSSATVPGIAALTSVGFANGLFFTIGAQPWYTRYVYSSPDGLNWSAASFPVHPGALDDSDGTVWGLGADGTYIAKAVFDLNLIAHLNANGQCVLSFQAGTVGTFEIVSTDTLSPGNWQLRETLTNVSGPIMWTDPQPPTASRFYCVRRK